MSGRMTSASRPDPALKLRLEGSDGASRRFVVGYLIPQFDGWGEERTEMGVHSSFGKEELVWLSPGGVVGRPLCLQWVWFENCLCLLTHHRTKSSLHNGSHWKSVLMLPCCFGDSHFGTVSAHCQTTYTHGSWTWTNFHHWSVHVKDWAVSSVVRTQPYGS